MPIDAERAMDTRALEIAMQAQTLISDHIVECRERWNTVHGMLKWIAGGVVALMLTVLGYLVDRYVMPPRPVAALSMQDYEALRHTVDRAAERIAGELHRLANKVEHKRIGEAWPDPMDAPAVLRRAGR